MKNTIVSENGLDPIEFRDHKIKLDNGEIYLDDFKVRGVLGYEIKKSSAIESTELTLRIRVEERLFDC